MVLLAGCKASSDMSAVERETGIRPGQSAGSGSISREQRQADRYFLNGSILEMQKRYGDAIAEYRRALPLNARSGALYYAMAKCFRGAGRQDSALFYAEKSVERDPENTGARLQYAELLLAANRFLPSAEQYEEIIRREPDNLEVRYVLARMWQRQDPGRAIVHYEYIRKNLGDDFDALLNLSDLYLDQRDYNHAIDVLVQLIDLSPDTPDLYRMLADAYLKGERYNEAIALIGEVDRHVSADSLAEEYYLDQLMECSDLLRESGSPSLGLRNYAETMARRGALRTPGSWRVKLHSGLVWYYLQSPGRADSLLGAALADSLSTASAWTMVATVYLGQGEYQRAVRLLAPAASRYRDESQVPYLLGVAYAGAGDNDSAVGLFRRSLALDDNNGDAWGQLASVYSHQHHIGASVAAYEKAIFYAPGNAGYLNNYAYLLAGESNQLDKALTMAKRALEAEPENESFLDTVGWIYYKLEDFEQAFRYIQRSVAIGGANAEVLGHLADVERARGDISAARESYQRALKLDPANAELRRKLESLK